MTNRHWTFPSWATTDANTFNAAMRTNEANIGHG